MFRFIYRTGFIAVLCLLVYSSLWSQGYIDEDFLENLHANASPMIVDKDPNFSATAAPAKWNKESAVIIGYSRTVMFDRKSSGGFFSRRERSLYFFEKTRFKVQLNDNNAVKTFSEVYFRYGSKEDGFIARIIKPGDTATTIDLKSAVAVERSAGIPEFFQSFFDKVAYSEYQIGRAHV